MRHARRMLGPLVAMLFVVSAVAAQTPPEFAGTWKLDPAQSRFPAHARKGAEAAAPRPDVTLVVERQGNVLKATRTVARGDRAHSITETYVADGADRTHAGRRGAVVSRAVFDGDRLVVTGTHARKGEQGDRTMSRRSVWTLSPDGAVLTIETTRETPRGDRGMTSVYLRG